jgi:hypothetical protein
MPKARQLPGTPEQLLEELFEIFPKCRSCYAPIHDDAPSFHSVLISFSPLVATALSTCTKSQLLAFANLVNAAGADRQDKRGLPKSWFGTEFTSGGMTPGSTFYSATAMLKR